MSPPITGLRNVTAVHAAHGTACRESVKHETDILPIVLAALFVLSVKVAVVPYLQRR